MPFGPAASGTPIASAQKSSSLTDLPSVAGLVAQINAATDVAANSDAVPNTASTSRAASDERRAAAAATKPSAPAASGDAAVDTATTGGEGAARAGGDALPTPSFTGFAPPKPSPLQPSLLGAPSTVRSIRRLTAPASGQHSRGSRCGASSKEGAPNFGSPSEVTLRETAAAAAAAAEEPSDAHGDAVTVCTEGTSRPAPASQEGQLARASLAAGSARKPFPPLSGTLVLKLAARTRKPGKPSAVTSDPDAAASLPSDADLLGAIPSRLAVRTVEEREEAEAPAAAAAAAAIAATAAALKQSVAKGDDMSAGWQRMRSPPSTQSAGKRRSFDQRASIRQQHRRSDPETVLTAAVPSAEGATAASSIFEPKQRLSRNNRPASAAPCSEGTVVLPGRPGGDDSASNPFANPEFQVQPTDQGGSLFTRGTEVAPVVPNMAEFRRRSNGLERRLARQKQQKAQQQLLSGETSQFGSALAGVAPTDLKRLAVPSKVDGPSVAPASVPSPRKRSPDQLLPLKPVVMPAILQTPQQQPQQKQPPSPLCTPPSPFGVPNREAEDNANALGGTSPRGMSPRSGRASPSLPGPPHELALERTQVPRSAFAALDFDTGAAGAVAHPTLYAPTNSFAALDNPPTLPALLPPVEPVMRLPATVSTPQSQPDVAQLAPQPGSKDHGNAPLPPTSSAQQSREVRASEESQKLLQHQAAAATSPRVPQGSGLRPSAVGGVPSVPGQASSQGGPTASQRGSGSSSEDSPSMYEEVLRDLTRVSSGRTSRRPSLSVVHETPQGVYPPSASAPPPRMCSIHADVRKALGLPSFVHGEPWLSEYLRVHFIRVENRLDQGRMTSDM